MKTLSDKKGQIYRIEKCLTKGNVLDRSCGIVKCGDGRVLFCDFRSGPLLHKVHVYRTANIVNKAQQ